MKSVDDLHTKAAGYRATSLLGALALCIFMSACTTPSRSTELPLPAAVRDQLNNRPMYFRSDVCQAEVPFRDFSRWQAAGDVLESVAHGEYIYFLTSAPLAVPTEGGGHADGVMVDGIFRTKSR